MAWRPAWWAPTLAVHAFGGEDPMFGGPWYHEIITRCAAREAGWPVREAPGDATTRTVQEWFTQEVRWSQQQDPPAWRRRDSAGESLAWVADYLDSYLYNPVWWVAGGLPRTRAAMLLHEDLIKVHFDDLDTTSQMRAAMQRYLGGTVAAVLHAGQRHRGERAVAAARHAIGSGLHAVQDFYSHSTWVDDPDRRGTTWFDLEAEAGSRTRAVDLCTGTYERHASHGRHHHGAISPSCTMLAKLGDVVPGFADLMDVLAAPLSPAQGFGFAEQWRDCRSAEFSDAGNDRLSLDPRNPEIPSDWIALHPPGIALDSSWLARMNASRRDASGADGEALFSSASMLAVTGSAQWLRMLEHAVVNAEGGRDWGAFWDEVKTRPRGREDLSGLPDALRSYLGGFDSDQREFERPDRQSVSFLAAGRYPPQQTAEHESQEWWLRVEVATSRRDGSGTDAPVHLVVDGVRSPDSVDHVEVGGRRLDAADGATPIDDRSPFRLDRMHRRTTGGGLAESRLLEHDDHEKNTATAYTVGPLSREPRSLELTIPPPESLVDAAIEDIRVMATRVLDRVGELVRSLVGGNADKIGEESLTWSWDQLTGTIASPETFRLVLDGGQEGRYRLHGHVTATPRTSGTDPLSVRRVAGVPAADGSVSLRGVLRGPPTAPGTSGSVRGALAPRNPDASTLDATVSLTRLECLAESTVDGATTDDLTLANLTNMSLTDEPFAIVAVLSPALPGRRSGWQRGELLGPFPGMGTDASDRRAVRLRTRMTVRVPRHGCVVLPVQMWESDLEGHRVRSDLAKEFVSSYGHEIAAPRSRLVDAIAERVGSQWRPRSVQATAFRRGRTSEVVTYPRVRVRSSLSPGETLRIPLGRADRAQATWDPASRHGG